MCVFYGDLLYIVVDSGITYQPLDIYNVVSLILQDSW